MCLPDDLTKTKHRDVFYWWVFAITQHSTCEQLTWHSIIEVIFSQGTEGRQPPAPTQGPLEFVVLSRKCLQSLSEGFVLLLLLL